MEEAFARACRMLRIRVPDVSIDHVRLYREKTYCEHEIARRTMERHGKAALPEPVSVQHAKGDPVRLRRPWGMEHRPVQDPEVEAHRRILTDLHRCCFERMGPRRAHDALNDNEKALLEHPLNDVLWDMALRSNALTPETLKHPVVAERVRQGLRHPNKMPPHFGVVLGLVDPRCIRPSKASEAPEGRPFAAKRARVTAAAVAAPGSAAAGSSKGAEAPMDEAERERMQEAAQAKELATKKRKREAAARRRKKKKLEKEAAERAAREEEKRRQKEA